MAQGDALVKVTYDLLRDVLGVSKSYAVMGVETMPEDFSGNQFTVKLRGEGLPVVPEGGEIPRIILSELKSRVE